MIDLSKQHTLDGEAKGIQQINSTESLDRAGDIAVKEIILDVSQGIVKYCKCIL